MDGSRHKGTTARYSRTARRMHCDHALGHGGDGSRSASSQSFLASRFPVTSDPQRGDLAVFSCYNKDDRELNLGHVAFFLSRVDEKHVKLIGGNQSGNAHGSIISIRNFSTLDSLIHRHVDGKLVECTFRLNRFVKIP